MDVTDARVADRLSWALIAAMLLLFATLQPADPIRIAPSTALLPGIGIMLLIALRLVGVVRRLPNLVVVADALLQMTLFTLAGLLLSYGLAAGTGALWDARLASWDAALGFDWPSLRSALDGSWGMVWLLTIAYHSLIPQMILVILLMSASGFHGELRTLILAAIIAGCVTVMLSGLMPAFGNLYSADSYRHLPPSVAELHAPIVGGLRDGSLRTVDLRQMMGIVTFPSFHAALALLFIGAFRQIPQARTPGTIWAGLTIIATPLSGGHYAVDVLAGLALATISFVSARYVVSARSSRAARPSEQPGASRFVSSS